MGRKFLSVLLATTLYGKMVNVNGHKMNTYIVSPVLTYTNALKELSPNYKITVIEPFGYGLSDVIGTDRTLENIVEELYEAVKQVLGDEEYFIMYHSISGVYSMKYVNDYRKKVLSFIGIDRSTPYMYDGFNVMVEDSGDSNENLDIPNITDVSDVSDEIENKKTFN